MISIVIPVLNEEKNIENLLQNLNSLNGKKEIIVVDGGSTDSTVIIASKYARVISSGRGRARQMNLGACNAAGDILWFLHCDSLVAPDSLTEIENVIKKGYSGGAFSHKFYDYTSPFLRYISFTSNLRARFLKLYFGDQGIFVRKDIFTALNGYPEIDIMEDWEFSMKLKKSGKTVLLKSPIGTSARRFVKGGVLRTFLLMQYIKLLYMLKIPNSKIAQIYSDIR